MTLNLIFSNSFCVSFSIYKKTFYDNSSNSRELIG